MSLQIAILQHIEFEGPAAIQLWAENHCHIVSIYKVYQNEKLPELHSFDMLIVMGGSMGVYDEEIYPWLKEEKKLIKNAIAEKKKILGICLGAQLIASALDANVYKAENKEIGWWAVNKTAEANTNEFGVLFPSEQTVFQWHGDTFDIPKGGTLLMTSQACRNQAFAISNYVLALQYHIEVLPHSIQALYENCGKDLCASQYTQSGDLQNNYKDKLAYNHQLLNNLLNILSKKTN